MPQTTFTVDEIRKYLISQDSRGDILYNLSEENIIKANDPQNAIDGEGEEWGKDKCSIHLWKMVSILQSKLNKLLMSLNSPQNPAITKYLDQNGRYSPVKSEAIREEYKDERRKLGRHFNVNASNLFDKILDSKKH